MENRFSMAAIQTEVNNNSGRQRTGVRRMSRHTLKIDMTPMVDLGFLLIAFFVITTELSKPTVMNLNMPTDGPNTPAKESMALSFLLGENNTIYYYEGKLEDALRQNKIFQTSYADKYGLRKIINEKQKRLDINAAINKEGRDGLILLIKATKEASYKNLVDVLDEVTISLVKKYVVVKPVDAENNYLKNHAMQ